MTWTPEHIRKRVIEAAKTLRMTSESCFPAGYKSNWPEPVREVVEAYGYGTVQVRVTPTARQLSEMEETWGWINTLEAKSERVEVYAYAHIKVTPGLTFAKYLEKNDYHRRSYERQMRKIFQRIADNVNRIPKMRNQAPPLQVSQNHAHERTDKMDRKRLSHWMAPGARPTVQRRK